MVQFGPSRGFGSGFQETFPASFQDALGKFIERKRGEKERKSEDIALKEKGFDIEGVIDPKTRQMLLEGQIQQKKSAGDSEKDALRTEAISKYFGPNIGQLYPQLTEGGKTKLTEVALTALSNNMSFEDALMQHVQKNPQDIQDFIPPQTFSELPQSKEPSGINLQDMKKPDQIPNVPKKPPKFSQKQTSAAQQAYAEDQAKRAAKLIDEADVLRKKIPQKRMALRGMENAIEEGNFGFLSPDYLADVTGVEGFRSKEGAQFVSSVKEYFLGDISRVGARPNQWIEQQLLTALPKMGRDKPSNMIITSSFRAKEDMEEKWLQEFDKLQKFYEDEIGYVPGRIGREVDEIVKPYYEKRQEQLEKEIKDIKKSAAAATTFKPVAKVPKGFVHMTNPETGEELFIKQSDITEAKKEGFKLKQ